MSEGGQIGKCGLRPGDRVRHKDGGPLGTVTKINASGNPMVRWDGDPKGLAMGYYASYLVLA